MENKREGSVLIPYKLKNDNLFIYLQKRSKDAKRLPDYFGMWGGGIEEGETPEIALVREMEEEMDFNLDIKQVKFLSRFENYRAINYVYLLEVSDGWEESITVKEGEYGKWFLIDDTFNSDKIIFSDKVIFNSVERLLLNKPIR